MGEYLGEYMGEYLGQFMGEYLGECQHFCVLGRLRPSWGRLGTV